MRMSDENVIGDGNVARQPSGVGAQGRGQQGPGRNATEIGVEHQGALIALQDKTRRTEIGQLHRGAVAATETIFRMIIRRRRTFEAALPHRHIPLPGQADLRLAPLVKIFAIRTIDTVFSNGKP